MNLFSLLGLDGLMARWRANMIEGAIALEDRADLARLEWADQKSRLIRLVILAVIAGGLTVIALIMFSLALLVQYWDTPNRAFVAWTLAVIWGVAWIAVLVAIIVTGKRASSGFALTRQVLAEDWKNVKERL